jgi:hypothetical protein
MKPSESNEDYESQLEPERGRYIIDVEPTTTVATTKLHPGEPDKPEEGDHLFHSQMWVKGTVITEISSAQGDKNSASSAQKNSHS